MDENALRFEVLDGYRLIRFLGRGGFGEVWLCQSESMGDYRALKFIPTSNSDRLEKEYEALLHYRKAAARLRSPHLVPIEHVNRNEAGLYYVMPLADGGSAAIPTDPAWQPVSLTTLIHARAEMMAWFSSQEIIALIRPVLDALQTLSDAGLVHRDVKPENILFFNGQPCLGDISLLGADASEITRRGTPGYATPSWYIGGHPDMYGAAATLYTLLTGNSPDKMGRSAFFWPPQGEKSLTPSEIAEWKRLHGIIRRATDEKVAERFVDFDAMVNSVAGVSPRKPKSHRVLLVAFVFIGAVAATTVAAFRAKQADKVPVKSEPIENPTAPSPPELTSEQKADYTALASMIQGYIGAGEYANALAAVENLLSTYPQARRQPAYSMAKAMALAGLKRMDEAKAELRKEVNLSPQITAMTGRKDLWEQMGDLEGAEDDLTRVLDKFGPNTFTYFLRADVRAQRKNFAGVMTDKQAAYDYNKNDPEQRRLVDAMWEPFPEKYPAFAKYLKAHPPVPSPDAPEATPGPSKFADQDARIIEVFDEIMADFTGPRSSQTESTAEARAKAKGMILEAFSNGNYAGALHLLDELFYSLRELPNVPVMSLFRAVLLQRMDRQDEVTRELRKPCHYQTEDSQILARVILMIDLHLEKELDPLLSRILEDDRSKADRPLEMTILLHRLRAKVRADRGDFAGAQNDFQTALDSIPSVVPVSDGKTQPLTEDDLRRMGEAVRETWKTLQSATPGYADYVKTLPRK
jgi:serine/threonine protein kinase